MSCPERPKTTHEPWVVFEKAAIAMRLGQPGWPQVVYIVARRRAGDRRFREQAVEEGFLRLCLAFRRQLIIG
jgi:hypothetical protein